MMPIFLNKDEENCDKKEKVYDSSTESDEENAEICSITKGKIWKLG